MPLSKTLSSSRSVGLQARYLKELGAHLRNKTHANGDRAQGLGRAALADDLSVLGMARMHAQSLASLASSVNFAKAPNGAILRAGYFLTQALIPIEAAQRTTRATNRLLRQRNATLRLHTAALAKNNRQLAREVVRRKAAELAAANGAAQYRALFGESQVMQRKLRLLTRQIILAQEEERKEISRELHDGVVQTLVGINVQLAALGQRASSRPAQLKAQILRTQRMVENSVNAVHRFARELRPSVLDDVGLIPALSTYCESLSSRKKIKISLTASASVETLDGSQRTALFRVAQEALTNVVRHAKATQAEVVITRRKGSGGATRMVISDNGRSFQVDKVFNARSQRLGLVGMRERMEMVGGKLSVESLPRGGTTVTAEISSRAKRAAK